MTADDLRRGQVYEVRMGTKACPLVVHDQLPHGTLFENLDTDREVFIRNDAIPKRVAKVIEDVAKWREERKS